MLDTKQIEKEENLESKKEIFQIQKVCPYYCCYGTDFTKDRIHEGLYICTACWHECYIEEMLTLVQEK